MINYDVPFCSFIKTVLEEATRIIHPEGEDSIHNTREKFVINKIIAYMSPNPYTGKFVDSTLTATNESALHLLVKEKYFRCCLRLVETYKANPFLRDKEGVMPLNIFISEGMDIIVKEICLKYKASAKISDAFPLATALYHLKKSKGNKEKYQRLLDIILLLLQNDCANADNHTLCDLRQHLLSINAWDMFHPNNNDDTSTILTLIQKLFPDKLDEETKSVAKKLRSSMR
jgi:hypothetical protein